MTCKTCGRAVHDEHVNAEGNCVLCEVTEAPEHTARQGADRAVLDDESDPDD